MDIWDKLNNALPSAGGYYQQKRLSNSMFDYVLPALKNKEISKKVVTPQMVFGTAFHTAVLEPHKFVETQVDNADLLLIRKMKQSICENKEISVFLEKCIKEVEYFFEIRGLPARLKADAIHIKSSHLLDIKTTSDISNLQKTVKNYNYDRQMAFYLDALELKKATLIFVCKKTFAVKKYTLSRQELQRGRDKYHYLLNLIVENNLFEKLCEYV